MRWSWVLIVAWLLGFGLLQATMDMAYERGYESGVAKMQNLLGRRS